MALVHSMWTKPMLKKERGAEIKQQIETAVWCSASSVAYAKLNNETIHLYGDGLAKDLLSFLPYDEIKTLNVPDHIPTEFWAAGKFFALKDMNLGDIHIDGDVFLKTPRLMDEIKTGIKENDLIVQSIENSWITLNSFYRRCWNVVQCNNIEFINGLNAEYSPAYNCGLVGFNNADFKELYLESYFDSIKQIYSNPNAMKMIRKDKKTWMDLLCEQQHLYNLAERTNAKVYNLLGEGKESYKKAIDVGYQHLLGTDKWNMLDQIKLQLFHINPGIYTDTCKKLANYL